MQAVKEKPEQQKTRFAETRLGRSLLSQETILLVITILAVGFLGSQNDRFLTANNLSREIILLISIALMAMPMTLIIITGGIDLSVGSTFGLSAVVLGFLWQDAGWALEVAIVASLIVGLVCGFLNGIFIVRLGVPPLIMTLATLALFRGMALGISEARSARGFPDWFITGIGRGVFLEVPLQAWAILIAALLTGIVLARTTFGRSLYAMGNNELAARFAGIPVGTYKLAIYTYSGFMASLSAVFVVARVTTTRSDLGSGIELDVIAAVLLGGTSIFGGLGTIWGTVLGLILIQVLKNGLLLAGVKGDATSILVGVVLILAILINNFIRTRFRSV